MRTAKTSIVLAKGLRLFRPSYRDRHGVTKFGERWAVEFQWSGKPRRVTAYADKGQSAELAKSIHRLTMIRASNAPMDPTTAEWVETMTTELRDYLLSIGVLTAAHASTLTPIATLLEEYEASLRAQGKSEKHITVTIARCKATLKGCSYWSDVTSANVETWLGEMRTTNKWSSKTFNYHTTAARMFANWCLRKGKLSASPLEQVGRAVVNDATERRGLTIAEARALLTYLRKQGGEMAGRALLYEVAMVTGFRRGELEALTVASFEFGKTAVVRLAGAHTKNHKAAMIQLPDETAKRVQSHLEGRGGSEKAFKVATDSQAVRIFRRDVAAARVAWVAEVEGTARQERDRSDFLKAVDGAGKVLVFHSLRHTRGTWLFHMGYNPVEVQKLMRVGSLALVERYSAGMQVDQEKMMTHSPSLTVTPTGNTVSITVLPSACNPSATESSCLASCLASESGVSRTLANPDGFEGHSITHTESPVNTGVEAVSNGVIMGSAPHGLLAELADAVDSKSTALTGVSVRLR